MAGSIYDMLMGEEPDARQTADAMARAIRGQRAMAALGGVAGHGLPGLGAVNADQAKQDQGQLEKAAEARMRYGAEKQNRDAMLKQTMMQLGSQAAMERERLKAQTDMYAADSSLRAAELRAANNHAEQARTDSAWQRYVDKTNPGLSSSRSVLGADKNVVQRVDRTLTLINSKPYLTPQEMADVNIALAGVLTGGNIAARKSIEEISAKTFQMELANMMQLVSNRPQDARAQKFVQRIAGTLAAEREAAKSRIRETITDHAIGMQDLLKSKGKAAIDYHRQFGVSDDILQGIGLDVGAYPTSPGVGAAPRKTAEQRAAELKSMPGMTKEKFTETLRAEGYVQ